MKKVWAITWKDLIIAFRDKAALLFMLVTPFGLTLAMLFAFGRSGNTPLSDISVHIVNYDTGEMGRRLIEVFQSDELADMVEPIVSANEAASRAAADADTIAAVVIIPADLSERLTLPAALAKQAAQIEVYANPARPISSGVVRGIVERFVVLSNASAAGVAVSMEQLVTSGRLPPAQALSVGEQIGQRVTQQIIETRPIALRQETAAGQPAFDWLSYYAPSMAILFLTFAMASRTRTILTEREMGTLPRLLSTPSSAAEIIAGKIASSFAIGVLQMLALVAATALLIGVQWGALLPLLVLLVITVAAMTSLGLAVAALSRTAMQANQYGSALVLLSSAISGHFFPRTMFPPWLKTLSYITPNTWSLEAFTQVAQGADVAGIGLHLLVLVGMGAAFFVVSIIAFRRQIE